MGIHIDINRKRIVAFCDRWKVTELSLFGSVLRDDFTTESDVDVLVTFKSDHGWSLFDLVTMRDELSVIFGRPVDLLTRDAVESSPNPYRRRAILESAEVLHAA